MNMNYTTYKDAVQMQDDGRKAYFAQELQNDQDQLEHLVHYMKKARFKCLSTATEFVKTVQHKQKIIDVKKMLI